MTRIYTAYGTPMDIAKREAKHLHKERGIKLSAAQQAYAIEKGYQSFGELVSKSIEIDDEVAENLTFARKHGRDEVWFCVDDAIDHLIDPEGPGGSSLWLTRELNVGDEEGTVLHRLSLGPQDDPYSDLSEPFEIRGSATSEEWDEALDDLDEGRAGNIIALLNGTGLFDLPIERMPHEFDHEAVLTLEMRKRGLIVGDRVLFSTGDNKAQGEPDFDRRCFVNLLSDGDVILTNGSAFYHELVWRVLRRSDYQALKAEMEATLGDLAYTTYQGEAWMFDRALASDAAETAPEPAPC